MKQLLRLVPTTLLLGLLCIGTATAQTATESPCTDTMTWDECLTELLNRQAEADGKFQEALKKVGDESSAAQKEVAWRTLAGSASANELNLEDALSSFLANLDIDGLENGDDGLRFKKNIQLRYGTLAIDVQAKQGELFPELKMKLDELDNDDLEEMLEDELGNLDNVNVSLSFTADRHGEKQDQWWGRRYRTPQGVPTGNARIANQLFLEARQPVDAITGQEAQKTFVEVSNLVLQAQTRHTESQKSRSEDLTPLTVEKTTNNERLKIFKAIDRFLAAEEADAQAFAQALGALESRLVTLDFLKFGQLVANQPQFIVEGMSELRDELTGRDSLAVSVKYEVGQANVNGLRAHCKAKGVTGANLNCFDSFLQLQNTALKKNWRVSFLGSYTWADSYDYTSPGDEVTLSLDEAEAWDLSFSAGRSLRLDDQGEVTRIDIEAKYKDPSGDTMQQSQFVGTATFTQRLNTSGLSASASFVYANRPEFRGEVDEELSARAGLKFRFNQPQ